MDYITHNVIVGNGEVPAVRTERGIEWVLPGGQRTRVKSEAVIVAARIDQLIKHNLPKFNRRILRK